MIEAIKALEAYRQRFVAVSQPAKAAVVAYCIKIVRRVAG